MKQSLTWRSVSMISALSAIFVLVGCPLPTGDGSGNGQQGDGGSGDGGDDPGVVLYITDFEPDQILTASGDAAGTTSLFRQEPAGSSPRGITYNSGTLYWTDDVLDRVSRIDTDGGNYSVVYQYDLADPNDNPIGITTDGIHLFWTELTSASIVRSDLDGSNLVTLFGGVSTIQSPQHIEVWGDLLYWADDVTDSIMVAQKEGSGRPAVLYDADPADSAANENPVGIAVNEDYVFYSDIGVDEIVRLDRDGTNPVTIWESTADRAPEDLTIVGSFLFWTESQEDVIYRSDLNGDNLIQLVDTGLEAPFGIVAVSK